MRLSADKCIMIHCVPKLVFLLSRQTKPQTTILYCIISYKAPFLHALLKPSSGWNCNIWSIFFIIYHEYKKEISCCKIKMLYFADPELVSFFPIGNSERQGWDSSRLQLVRTSYQLNGRSSSSSKSQGLPCWLVRSYWQICEELQYFI